MNSLTKVSRVMIKFNKRVVIRPIVSIKKIQTTYVSGLQINTYIFRVGVGDILILLTV
jgi:hypothetical protein